MRDEINFKGKVAIGLEENNYVLRDNVLVAVIDGLLNVYQIKEELSRKEKELLNQNLSKGLSEIKSKVRESAPVTVTNGTTYFDDWTIVTGFNGMAYLVIF